MSVQMMLYLVEGVVKTYEYLQTKVIKISG